MRHPETGNLSHWRNDWDASFIASANPAAVLELLDACDALEAENKALREERDDLSRKLDRFYSQSHGIKNLSEIERLNAEIAAMRARVVVVPERDDPELHAPASPNQTSAQGWNACLDELARLNGKTVSEELLRKLLDNDGIDGKFDAQEHYAAHQELRALLGEGKEVGDVLVRE
ncbi:hypothetical protein D9M69_470770 [compost metagenome]